MPDFKYINNEKIDLSRQDHRDVVIQRNKALDLAIKKGLDAKFSRVTVEVKVELECLKCGSQIRNLNEEVIDDYEYDEFEVDRNFPIAKCCNCETRYIYDRSEGNFAVVLKKEHLNSKKQVTDAKL